jgi:hypothetical protein
MNRFVPQSHSTAETVIRRKSLEEKISHLEQINLELKSQADHHLELMCRIVANATGKGWDVEYLLSPLKKNVRELVGS